jgi:hypothetical protein
VKLRHRVIETVWEEVQGVWRFKIKDLATGEVKKCWGHVFINASGYVNNW